MQMHDPEYDENDAGGVKYKDARLNALIDYTNAFFNLKVAGLLPDIYRSKPKDPKWRNKVNFTSFNFQFLKQIKFIWTRIWLVST